MMEGVNPTKIYFKYICKHHNVAPVQLLNANKVINKKSLHFPFTDIIGKLNISRLLMCYWYKFSPMATVSCIRPEDMYPTCVQERGSAFMLITVSRFAKRKLLHACPLELVLVFFHQY
jgi:hypothetical protein